MNLILKEKNELVTVLEWDEELERPLKIDSLVYCSGCRKNHVVVFKHIGMHDDGEIYELRSIH